MFRIENVNENNKQPIIDSLKLDVIRHVFAFYDILHEPEHTTMYAALEDGDLKGYILVYTALKFQSVVLECDSDIAEKLVPYAPENHFIMHVPPNLLPIIKRRYHHAKHYLENWMLVKKYEANLFNSKLVRRLSTENDATKLAILLSNRRDRPRETVKKYIDLINKQPIFGVFLNRKLISYAGSFIQLPQLWMMGGVYTHPT